MWIPKVSPLSLCGCRLAASLIVMFATVSGCRPRFSCPRIPYPDQGANALVSQGSKPAFHLALDPQDAQFAIDPACSTYCYEDDGYGWQTAVSGTVGLTIDPTCTDSACMLTISQLHLQAKDQISNGHAISAIDISSDGYALGTWQNDNTFTLPKLSTSIYTDYHFDGIPAGRLVINAPETLWGIIDSPYENFYLSGNVVVAATLGVNLNLCGHPIARPPVPVLTPTGQIPTDAPGVAHVTFTSEQSHDPDNDIQHKEWRLDRYIVATDVDTLPTTLSLGSHTVSVTVIDSRSVRITASVTVTVVDA